MAAIIDDENENLQDHLKTHKQYEENDKSEEEKDTKLNSIDKKCEEKEEGEGKRREKDKNEEVEVEYVDPELFSCLLQPIAADSDLDYIGIRRLLLYWKAQSGVCRRNDWRCNERGYVAYRNYINRPWNWESLLLQSRTSTPNQSGRWVASPAPLSLLYEVDSLTSSRELRGSSHARNSFSSSTSDYDRSDRPRKKAEPAYSFVGMHCIFDQCKVAVTTMKFGHMSSDLLAYGAADGSLTVCIVAEPPTVIKELRGHSKDVTG